MSGRHDDPDRQKGPKDSGGGMDTPERERRREELLRPWPTLGYDRHRIAMHLLSKEAFRVAEEELRRAVWLNPFEWRFKKHLAWCLYREKKFAEAREWIVAAMDGHAEDAEAREIRRLIEKSLEGTRGGRRDGEGDMA